MMAMKIPKILPSPYARATFACPICGIEIDPLFSKSNKYCPECNGDVCFNNAKHHVKTGYCMDCHMHVKRQAKYQQWFNHNLPNCNVSISKDDC